MNAADDERAERSRAPRWVWIVVLAAATCALIAYVAYMALGMPGMDHGYSTQAGMLG